MTLNVFLDANVLVPVGLTDLLLRLAEKGVIDPHWSPDVLDEVARAITRLQPDRPVTAIQRRFDAMNEAFPYATVNPSKTAIESFNLPDVNDRHVTAAASACEAKIIVTHNVKDFPAAALAPHGLQALTPDELLLDLLDQDEALLVAAIKEAAAATRNPHLTTTDIIASLSKVYLPRFATAINAYLGSGSAPSDAIPSQRVPPEI